MSFRNAVSHFNMMTIYGNKEDVCIALVPEQIKF